MNRVAFALSVTSLLVGCPRAPQKEERASRTPQPATSATTQESRGKIVEVPPRGFRYDYYDVGEANSHVAELQAKGFQGGGPTWEGIVYGLLALESPATLELVEFDPEAEGLAIWSQDRAALELIGVLVARAKSDPDLLARAIQRATADDRME